MLRRGCSSRTPEQEGRTVVSFWTTSVLFVRGKGAVAAGRKGSERRSRRGETEGRTSLAVRLERDEERLEFINTRKTTTEEREDVEE